MIDMKNKAWIKAGLAAAGIDILLAILSAIPCIGCIFAPISCIAWLVLPLACGYLAAMWAGIKKDQYQEAALQGALSGLVLGVVGGIVDLIISLISAALNIGSQSTLSFLEEQNSSYMKDLAVFPVGVGGALIFGSICCVVGIVITVALSALGGIIYVALSKRK